MDDGSELTAEAVAPESEAQTVQIEHLEVTNVQPEAETPPAVVSPDPLLIEGIRRDLADHLATPHLTEAEVWKLMETRAELETELLEARAQNQRLQAELSSLSSPPPAEAAAVSETASDTSSPVTAAEPPPAEAVSQAESPAESLDVVVQEAPREPASPRKSAKKVFRRSLGRVRPR